MEYIDTTCFNCGDVDAETFLVEPIGCPDCNTEILITYNRCTKCGTVWKAVGDEILSALNIDDFECPMGMPNDYILDNVDLDDVPIVEHISDGDDSMEDQIRRCVRCDEPAYEIEDGLYKCSDDVCTFEWEVIKCG